MNVMDSGQSKSQRFPDGEKVPEIGASIIFTSMTRTIFINRLEIVLKFFIGDMEIFIKPTAIQFILLCENVNQPMPGVPCR